MGIHKGSFLVRNFLKYSVIFGEGTRGDCAYLLKEGQVELSRMVNGRKKVFAILKPVSMFGEMAILLGDRTRTATAVALSDIKVVEIGKYDFEDFIEKSPVMISSLLQVLVHRLKTATTKSLYVPNLYTGVCNILDLHAQHNASDLNCQSAVQHMAMALNTDPDSIENNLRLLEEYGIIKLTKDEKQQRIIHIRELEDLTARAMARRKEAMEV